MSIPVVVTVTLAKDYSAVIKKLRAAGLIVKHGPEPDFDGAALIEGNVEDIATMERLRAIDGVERATEDPMKFTM